MLATIKYCFPFRGRFRYRPLGTNTIISPISLKFSDQGGKAVDTSEHFPVILQFSKNKFTVIASKISKDILLKEQIKQLNSEYQI